MAQYSVLNFTDLEAILAHYRVEKVQSYKILSGGSENTNYLIKTQTKAYVLTICEQKSAEKATELMTLLDYLNGNNFATSKVVKATNGSLITVWCNKPVMLKEFIEGNIIKDLSGYLLRYLGKELAKLHQIKAPDYLPKMINYGIDRFDEVQAYAPDSTFYIWLKKTQKYIEGHINTDLPKALIHSDIFYDNIIVNKNGKQASIMDFEEACYYYRVFDIGMMIIGTCSKGNTLDLDKVSCLLEGYQQKIDLLPIEINALQAFTVYGAAATAFWRHQNFNFVNVDETMAKHYLAMKILADSIMGISAQEFKNLFSL